MTGLLYSSYFQKYSSILQKCKIKVSFVRLGYGKPSFFAINYTHKEQRSKTMKRILQKKRRKPSQKDIERVQLGCAMMQAQFQLMGY
ncbi:hypothetical protein HMPREF9189_0691 [Streptococcus sp. oral taxon 071 str. 73H25AP]|nr:hypothetical protein HMPREF9189_0691 [Streptococcus sp. oral taxon 071 str. 73H25AP]